MTFRDQLLLVAALLLLPLPLHGADEAQRTQFHIEQDIRDLESDDFAVREAATKRLKAVGRPAIAPLVQSALNGKLEATDRALQVLTSFYGTEDDATLDELDTALEELVDSAQPSAARRAAAAIAVNAENRDERAVIKLVELKAMVRPLGIRGVDEDVGGPLQIWIDDQWQGGDSELRLFRRLRPGRLNALYRVENCPASLDAVRKLEQQIAGMTVQERGTACLGLGQGEPKARGFEIQQATPEGSIAAAGMRDHDVIIKYAGEDVNNFEQLVEMIKKNKVGDTVKVEYLRLIKNDDNLIEEVQLSADVRLKGWREVFDETETNRQKKAKSTEFLPEPDPDANPDPLPENDESPEEN